MSLIAWPNKDPHEVLDYRVDWTAALAGDTISSSIFQVAAGAGLTVGSGGQAPTNTTTTATVWLLGGAEGQRCKVMNRIVTAAGRTMDRTMTVLIKTK